MTRFARHLAARYKFIYIYYGCFYWDIMKLIKFRKKLDKSAMSVALFFGIFPVLALLTGTAFLVGSFGGGYLEADLSSDPGTYWYIILLELSVVLWLVVLSLFDFPLIKNIYESVLKYKSENIVVSYIGFYLILPIAVVAFCLVLLLIFDA
jgi:hypothetical protein